MEYRPFQINHEMALKESTEHKMELVIHAARFLQKHGNELPDFVDMAFLTAQILADACDGGGSNSKWTAADLTAKVFKVIQEWGSSEGCCSDGDYFRYNPGKAVMLSKMPLTTGNLIYRAVNSERTEFLEVNRKAIFSLLTRVDGDAVSPYASYRHEQPIKIDEAHCSVKLYNEENGMEATVILGDKAAKLLAGH